MEKPGWGVVAVIVIGIAALSIFLIFPDQGWKDFSSTDEGEIETSMFGDQRAKDLARDTMQVVDGTESKDEIVRGSANPTVDLDYNHTDSPVIRGDMDESLGKFQENSLSDYLDSLTADASTSVSIFVSISTGDFTAVRHAFDSSSEDMHQVDHEGNSVLHYAAAQGSVDIGAFLVRYGAKVNAVNANQNTPLDIARLEGRAQFVEFLLAYGAKPGNSSDTRPVPSL